MNDEKKLKLIRLLELIEKYRNVDECGDVEIQFDFELTYVILYDDECLFFEGPIDDAILELERRLMGQKLKPGTVEIYEDPDDEDTQPISMAGFYEAYLPGFDR